MLLVLKFDKSISSYLYAYVYKTHKSVIVEGYCDNLYISRRENNNLYKILWSIWNMMQQMIDEALYAVVILNKDKRQTGRNICGGRSLERRRLWNTNSSMQLFFLLPNVKNVTEWQDYNLLSSQISCREFCAMWQFYVVITRYFKIVKVTR